ncbi:MAG: hypothetical protein JEZ14_21875 [Marinilabiliaceae bacterium]|nr:hypothetical protein [Marinilabiliaceae bacterium]
MRKICLFILMTLLILSCSVKQNEQLALIKGEVLSGKAEKVKFDWMVDNPISDRGETYGRVR